MGFKGGGRTASSSHDTFAGSIPHHSLTVRGRVDMGGVGGGLALLGLRRESVERRKEAWLSFVWKDATVRSAHLNCGYYAASQLDHQK